MKSKRFPLCVHSFVYCLCSSLHSSGALHLVCARIVERLPFGKGRRFGFDAFYIHEWHLRFFKRNSLFLSILSAFLFGCSGAGRRPNGKRYFMFDEFANGATEKKTHRQSRRSGYIIPFKLQRLFPFNLLLLIGRKS